MNTALIPDSHRDLFEKKSLGHLATLMRDGSVQVTPVWVDAEGPFVLVNTATGRVKDKNMRVRPQVGIEILDPADTQRYLSVRGDVAEIIEGEAAEAHIHTLAQRYLGHSYPNAFRAPGEKRVIFKIQPTHVHVYPPPIPEVGA